jgi:predicted Rossmann fold nucleotide-binding protein DprA/Smf involved in DNA uptake
MVLSSTYQSTDNPLLSTLYEPLSKHLITVLGLLPSEETHIEAIIHASQLPAQAVASILLTLELRGLVRQFPGKFFVRC